MSRGRVLVLLREGLEPPDSLEGHSEKEILEWKCEFDVVHTLDDCGYDVHVLGVYDDLSPVRDAILEQQPDVAFMLLEEFHGVTGYDQAVVSYLELMRQAYTGCNPLGMMLSRNKALAKKILLYHRIATPHFAVFSPGRKIRRSRKLDFPLLVKSAAEDASKGISQASVVRDDRALEERVRFIHDNVGGDAIVEQYIEGRELYQGVIGNSRLQTFPIWEMDFKRFPADQPRIATHRIKWDEAYRDKYGVITRAATDLPVGMEQKIARLCKRAYRELSMSGYARFDLRLTDDGRVFLIEANCNPNLSYGEDFAESAHVGGVEYEELLTRIVNLGIQYPYPWKA